MLYIHESGTRSIPSANLQCNASRYPATKKILKNCWDSYSAESVQHFVYPKGLFKFFSKSCFSLLGSDRVVWDSFDVVAALLFVVSPSYQKCFQLLLLISWISHDVNQIRLESNAAVMGIVCAFSFPLQNWFELEIGRFSGLLFWFSLHYQRGKNFVIAQRLLATDTMPVNSVHIM